MLSVLAVLIASVAILAFLGRTVWVPLSMRPVEPRDGIGRDVLLGLIVLGAVSDAYAARLEGWLGSTRSYPEEPSQGIN